MIPFEPGILNAAHAKGIYLTDLNGDNMIDQKDLDMAVAAKAKAGAVATAPAVKAAVATGK